MRSAVPASMILLALSSAACHTMRPVTLESLAASNPGQVWVTRTDQSVILVSGPRMINNRLVGFVNGKYQVVPAADVQQITLRQVSAGKTGALVGAGAVGAGVLLYVISGTGGHDDPCASASSDACQTGDLGGG